MDPADRKRLRAIARAVAPTVAAGDMLRFSLTRMLEKKLGKAAAEPTPVPLPERAAAVCELYAALAQCRFGVGKQGQNAYRAGLMGMLLPQKWVPYPEVLVPIASLDTTLTALAQIHPTGKRSFSEGMARVIAVGGRLTVPQVDLLRGVCLVVDCPVPLLPIDVVFEEADVRQPRVSGQRAIKHPRADDQQEYSERLRQPPAAQGMRRTRAERRGEHGRGRDDRQPHEAHVTRRWPRASSTGGRASR